MVQSLCSIPAQSLVEAKSDTSLFVYRRGTDTIYLLYVDDIVLTASSSALLQQTIQALQQEFSMKDLGELHHFLGMHVRRCGPGLLLLSGSTCWISWSALA